MGGNLRNKYVFVCNDLSFNTNRTFVRSVCEQKDTPEKTKIVFVSDKIIDAYGKRGKIPCIKETQELVVRYRYWNKTGSKNFSHLKEVFGVMCNTNAFLGVVSYYNGSSLGSLITLMQGEFIGKTYDKEAYLGARRLFARIKCTLDHSSKNCSIDFTNIYECELVANLLMPFLLHKYQDDYEALCKYVDNGAITEKQFHYELAFSKSYPRIFVTNIVGRLTPFNNVLARYDTSALDVSKGLERLFLRLSKPMTMEQIISKVGINMGRYFSQKLLDALVRANEKIDSIEAINAFSKEPYFPVSYEEGSYYLLSAEELMDNFYKCLHRLFMKNSSQADCDILMNKKGANFNRMCANLFRNDFGFGAVYENMSYSNGEIDLVIIEKDCLFIIECKSRNYTSKISGQSMNFIKANQSNLDNAYDQINRFLKCLNKGDKIRLKSEDGSAIHLCASDFKYIIPLVINLDNLAELNADYDSRDQHCAYISYDDLTTIQQTIEKRRWLLVDFLDQLILNAKSGAPADDIIDMFAFYCQCKNLGILFENKTSVVVNGLGNDYFHKYFSYLSEKRPITEFDTDIGTFEMIPGESFAQCITRYHEKGWRTAKSFFRPIK